MLITVQISWRHSAKNDQLKFVQPVPQAFSGGKDAKQFSDCDRYLGELVFRIQPGDFNEFKHPTVGHKHHTSKLVDLC